LSVIAAGFRRKKREKRFELEKEESHPRSHFHIDASPRRKKPLVEISGRRAHGCGIAAGRFS